MKDIEADLLIANAEIRQLKAERDALRKEVLKHRAKEARNYKLFDFVISTRKNGTEFIKVIYYSNEYCGWVEVARVNLSKHEWVQDKFSIWDIFSELKGVNNDTGTYR